MMIIIFALPPLGGLDPEPNERLFFDVLRLF